MEKFALTQVQLAYMLGRNGDFESGNIATHYYNEILNDLDVKRFERALNQVIAKHDMLHTVIHTDATQSTVEDYPYYQVRYEDFSAMEESEREAARMEIRNALSHKKYEIGTMPMFDFVIAKMAEGKKILFVSIDLITADASSIMILFNDLYAFYQDETLKVVKPETTFADFIHYTEELHTKPVYQKDRQFWMDLIPEMPMGPSLPVKQDLDEEDMHFQRLTFISEGDSWKRCRDHIKKKGLIQTSYLCECYREVLGYWSGSQHFSINLTTTNRGKLAGTENVIGDFTSLTILPMPETHSDHLWENAKEMQSQLIKVYAHSTYDGIDVEREYRKQHRLMDTIPFPVVFTSLMGGGKETFDRDFFAGTDYSVSQTPQVYLDCQVSEEEDTLIVTWDYPRGRYDAAMMQHMFDQFTALIMKPLEETGSDDLSEILKAPDEDLEAILRYNQTAQEVQTRTLQEVIEQSCKTYADRIALIDQDEVISYETLMHEIKNIASFLHSKNLQKGDRIAVIGHRNARTVAFMIACAYMGMTFVPIHPEYPKERRQYIIDDSKATFVYDYETEQIPDGDGSDLPDVKILPDEEAYIIYTSGSTGNPKGVVITHRAVYNTLWDMNQRFGITEQDRILNVSEYGFDLSVYDIFGTLLAGAAMVINRDVRDIAATYETMIRHHVTIWNSVPAIYGLLLTYAEGRQETNAQATLRTVLLSGDFIPLDLFDKSKQLWDSAKLISLGGATEASIWSIYYPIASVEENWNSIPYGYPLANQTIFVMDQRGNVLPVGVTGEICIGGIGVAKGYTSEELTAQRFFVHPQFGRIYRTGDAGILRQNGYVDIIGRIDMQVKINGYRIEMQEIETAIASDELIENAFAEIVDQGNSKRIIALIVPKDGEKLDEEDIADLRDAIAKVLPAYMIPYHFEQLERVPLNSNGKVDHKQLKQIASTIQLRRKTLKKPEGKIQTALFDAWSDLLSHYEFSVDDDFFDVGGDSLKMIYQLAFIEDQFGVKIGGRAFLENATIEKIADIIEERQSK